MAYISKKAQKIRNEMKKEFKKKNPSARFRGNYLYLKGKKTQVFK